MTKVSDLEPIPGYGYSLPAKPVAMPSEEDFTKLAVGWMAEGRYVASEVVAKRIYAFFAPILAEKENLACNLDAIQSDHADTLAMLIEANAERRALNARALAAEAALAAALEALGPFADEKNGVIQDLLWGDQPDSATMTITCPLGHVRKARELVRAAAIRAQGE